MVTIFDIDNVTLTLFHDLDCMQEELVTIMKESLHTTLGCVCDPLMAKLAACWGMDVQTAREDPIKTIGRALIGIREVAMWRSRGVSASTWSYFQELKIDNDIKNWLGANFCQLWNAKLVVPFVEDKTVIYAVNNPEYI